VRVLRRVTLAATAIALLAGVVLGSTSLRAEVSEYEPPPGVTEVDCGSVFSEDPDWAGDEGGCQRVLMHRLGYVVMSFFLAFIFGAISAVLVFIGVRRTLYSSTACA
jgi:hypothetical protein